MDPRSARAEARFRARLAELGAVLLEPAWLGVNAPHRVRCAAGHLSTPRPNHVLAGWGICRKCAQARNAGPLKKARVAEARFRARLAELGAVLLEPAWLGVNAPHRVRCAAGHLSTPRPSYALRGGGVCPACAGHDPEVAEARFRARLAELGAVLLEPAWLGSGVPHRVRCAAGHACAPRPADVGQGRGICRACAKNDPRAAEARFRARLAELGAVLLEPYRNAKVPHRVRCAAGHECAPSPDNLRKGQGLCLACVDKSPEVAEARFRARLAELGAVLLESAWLGAQVAHRVRCAAGHLCAPRPDNVVNGGRGICAACAGQWDVFYVVADVGRHRIKLGITSGDPRSRLAGHRTAGYRDVVRLMTGLPGTAAPEIESAVLATLALAGVRPVQGREYYDAAALAVVLDVADNYPLPASLPAPTLPRPGDSLFSDTGKPGRGHGRDGTISGIGYCIREDDADMSTHPRRAAILAALAADWRELRADLAADWRALRADLAADWRAAR